MGMFELPRGVHPDFDSARSAYSDSVEINTDNPITDKLVGCYVATPAGMFDLVSRKFATKEGDWAFRQGSSYYDGSGDDEYFTAPISGAANWTIGCSTQVLFSHSDRRFMSLGSASNSTMIGLGTSHNIAPYNSLRGFYRMDSGASQTFAVGGSDLRDRVTANSITLRADEGILYHGLRSGDSKTLSTPNNFYPAYLAFGAIKRASLSNFCDCRVHLGWVFNRVLNPREIKALHKNPDQLIRPRLPVFYSLPDAAPAATYTLAADAGSYAVTGQSSNLLHHRKLTADAGSYTLTGQPVSLLHNRRLIADPGSYSLTGQNAGLLYNRALLAESGSYNLSGVDAGLLHNRTLTAESGSYSLAGQDAGLLHNRVLLAESGSYTLTGVDVTLTYTPSAGPTYTLTAESGAYAVAGQDAGLRHNRVLTAESGSYSITGNDAALKQGYRLNAESGNYTLTGQAVDFSRAYVLAAESGNYTLSGQEADTLYNRRLVAESGNYTLTGLDVTLVYTPGATYTLTAESGLYSLTGSDAGLLHNRVLTAESGNYALSGSDAALLRQRTLVAESGNYSLTGQATNFVKGYRLAAESGSYTLLGNSVSLLYSGISGEITGLLFKASLSSQDLVFRGSLDSEIVFKAPLDDGALLFRGQLSA